MPEYGEILAFLANNPPQLQAERELHASLLELLAKCLRADEAILEGEADELIDMPRRHFRWVHFN